MASKKKPVAKKPSPKKPAAAKKPAAKKAAPKKPSPKKPAAAKKPAAKKAAPKKPSAKKPAAKKSAPKKSVAKNSPAAPKKPVASKPLAAANKAAKKPAAKKAAPKKSVAPPPPPARVVAPAEGGELALWNLIERVGIAVRAELAGGGGDDLEASCRQFRRELEVLDDPTLVAVESAFSAAMQRAYDYRVWHAAYVMHGGSSDDTFWDFRAGLIAMGRRIYEAALADPDSLASIEDVENRTLFEGFQYEPDRVLEARGLASAGPGHHLPQPTGTRFNYDAAEHQRVLPKLHARFG